MLESLYFMGIRDFRIQKAFDWLAKENGENFLAPDEHCPTRDVKKQKRSSWILLGLMRSPLLGQMNL